MALTKAHNRMISDAPVNVRDFGAVGDGATDDQAAFQAAIDAGEGAIFIPSGTYNIGSPIRMGSRRILYGEGDSSVLSWSGGANTVIEVYADLSGSTALANVGLERFKISGNNTDGMTGIHWIYASVQSYIKNVFINGTGENSCGLRVSKTWYADFDTVSIRNNPADVKTGSVGLWLDGSVGQVNGITFENIQTNAMDIGIKLDTSANYIYAATFLGGLVENGNVGVQHVTGTSGVGVRTASFNGMYFEGNDTAEIDWQTSTPLDRTGAVTWQGCSFFSGSVVIIDEGSHWFLGNQIISSLVLNNGGNQNVYTDSTFPSVTGAFASSNYKSGGSPNWNNPGTYYADVRGKLLAGQSVTQTIAGGVQPAKTFLVPNFLARTDRPAGIQLKVMITGARNYDAPLSKITEGYLNKNASGTWAFETTYNKSAVDWTVTVNASGGVDVKFDAGDTKYVTVQFIPM